MLGANNLYVRGAADMAARNSGKGGARGKARDQAGLDRAKKAVEDAIKVAEQASHVGFLTVSDRSAFPRIVGSKGANVARLRAETGAEITVGRDDNIITLVGT